VLTSIKKVVKLKGSLQVKLIKCHIVVEIIANEANILHWFVNNWWVALCRDDSALLRELLSQRHLVFAQLYGINLWIFTQKLKEASRNHQLIRGDFAHIDFFLHAIDEARQGFTVKTFHKLLMKGFFIEFNRNCFNFAGKLVKIIVSKGFKPIDQILSTIKYLLQRSWISLHWFELNNYSMLSHLNFFYWSDIEHWLEVGLLIVFIL